MPATLDQVRQIIQREFPGADVQEIVENNHRLMGAIVWPGFANMGAEERNRLVTERIRYRLGLEGTNLGVLFPVAPGEYL